MIADALAAVPIGDDDERIERKISDFIQDMVNEEHDIMIKYDVETLFQDRVDLKLGEKLRQRSELKGHFDQISQALQLDSPCIFKSAVEEGVLYLGFPITVETCTQVDKLGQDILFLELEISRSIDRLNEEENAFLTFILSHLSELCMIYLIIQKVSLSDYTLLEILKNIFWKTPQLTAINLEDHTKNFYNTSLFHFSQKILPFAQRLQHLSLSFEECDVTLEAFNSLCEQISILSPQLHTFMFGVNCKAAKANSLKKIFVEMPNLQSFAYQSSSLEFDDEALEEFIFITLPSLKKLKKFQFFIPNCTITNTIFSRLFPNFPQEWRVTLKELRLDLSNTKISEATLNTFIGNLPLLTNLERFEVGTDNNEMSEMMIQKAINAGVLLKL